MKTTPFRVALCALTFSLFTAGSWAEFVGPQLVPVKRLLKSAEANLAKKPTDAEAHYLVARIRYLAFVMQRDGIPALPNFGNPEATPQVIPRHMQGWEPAGEKGAALTAAQMKEYAARALPEFEAAMKIAPDNGLYALGQASLLDAVRTWIEKTKPADLPTELQGITVQRVRAAYAGAFRLAIVQDARIKAQPTGGLKDIVAYEAATALVRLGKDTPADLSAAEKADVEKSAEAVAKFEKLPMGVITPIVFSFQPAAHLDAMLDKEHIVNFDLRGYGRRDEQWTWVKPELGLLVWDPLESGEIKSAHQLFGGYTFQIFRQTGYDAMAALDDNQDGVLSGAELEGMSVWFDRDRDGRSTSAEVTPLRELGVEALAVTATTQDGAHPKNPRGLTMKDGRTLPTWDWMVAPVR
jgi:hypothetical protein